MKEVAITVDVICFTPGTIYRLYVNDELLTERTFTYTPEFCITESIILKCEPGHYTISAKMLNGSVVLTNLVNTDSDFTFNLA